LLLLVRFLLDNRNGAFWIIIRVLNESMIYLNDSLLCIFGFTHDCWIIIDKL
jgi:hypothetical protein